MATRPKLTAHKLDEFIELLGNNGGIVSDAAKDLRLSRQALYKRKAEDEDFFNRWEAAVQLGVEIHVDEAKRRALIGTAKPIYYKGKKIGHVYEKSDQLLAMLLRAHRREYRDKHEVSVPDGIPITMGGQVVIYLPDNNRDRGPDGSVV